MGEAELVEIESRIEHYPPQARHDILRLTAELRRRGEAGSAKKAAHAGSPLYDTATGLLNGGAYGVRFAMARARATRYRKIFAVMSVDVDISMHANADREQTIRDVAARLEDCVRETDTLARIGEDSFAIILEDLAHPGQAERVKQNVQEALDAPRRIGERNLAPQADVRLQFYPGPEVDSPIKYDS